VIAPDPVTSSAPHDAGPPPVELGPPGPIVIRPTVPKLVTGMMDHAFVYGWSADSERFGHCATNGGRGDTRCELFTKKGAREVFDDWNETKDEEDPIKRAALDKRIKELALRATSKEWAFARDLELTWDTPTGNTLRVGARVRGEAPSYSIVLHDTKYCAPDGSIHPEVIAVSPDGATVGAMAHCFQGEFSDVMVVATLPSTRVAAHAYHAAGVAHLQKDSSKRAAELFALARAADPTLPVAAPVESK